MAHAGGSPLSAHQPTGTDPSRCGGNPPGCDLDAADGVPRRRPSQAPVGTGGRPLIHVTVYSEEPFLLAGVEAALQGSQKFQLAGACRTLEEIRAQLSVEAFGIALLDLTAAVTLPELHDLRLWHPRTAIVLWVDRVATEFASQAIFAGVRGILRRNLPIEQQLLCLEKVDAGELWVEPDLCHEMLATQQVPLTRREQQLVRLLAQGLKNKELAYTLGVTEGTVKVYLSRLFQKVGCKDRFELAIFALRNYSSEQLGVRAPAAAWPGANIADATPSNAFSLYMLFAPVQRASQESKSGLNGTRSDPQLVKQRQDLLLRLPPKERALALQSSHGLNNAALCGK